MTRLSEPLLKTKILSIFYLVLHIIWSFIILFVILYSQIHHWGNKTLKTWISCTYVRGRHLLRHFLCSTPSLVRILELQPYILTEGLWGELNVQYSPPTVLSCSQKYHSKSRCSHTSCLTLVAVSVYPYQSASLGATPRPPSSVEANPMGIDLWTSFFYYEPPLVNQCASCCVAVK